MKRPEKRNLLCNNGIEDAGIILHNLHIDAWWAWIDNAPIEDLMTRPMTTQQRVVAIRKLLKGET